MPTKFLGRAGCGESTAGLSGAACAHLTQSTEIKLQQVWCSCPFGKTSELVAALDLRKSCVKEWESSAFGFCCLLSEKELL